MGIMGNDQRDAGEERGGDLNGAPVLSERSESKESG